MNNKIARFLKEPKRYTSKIIYKYFSWLLSDKQYVKAQFLYTFGYPLDLESPKTFCEKLQWLKLYDRNPKYTTMVDKYEVKKYVAEIIGEEYIIPTLAVWDKPQDIDWNTLPNQFVLKTTHGGGGNGVIICKEKELLDKRAIIKQLESSLDKDLYKEFREWPYKDVPKRIIAEKFMAPEKSPAPNDLPDYKFFCFDGKVKFFKVDFGRFVEHHANYYSPEGELLEFGEQGLEPDPNYLIELPNNLKEMISMAEKLSANEPFIRVDLFNVNGKIFFGELTFYPASGFGSLTPNIWNLRIGDMILLKTK